MVRHHCQRTVAGILFQICASAEKKAQFTVGFIPIIYMQFLISAFPLRELPLARIHGHRNHTAQLTSKEMAQTTASAQTA